MILKKKAARVKHKKKSNVKKSRGYGFEYRLVNKLNRRGIAKRLAAVGQPDVIFSQSWSCPQDIDNFIYIIEAKCTGYYDEIFIKNDQLQMCFDWVKIFNAYNNKKVMFAFRFQGSKRIRREIKEYLFENDIKDESYFKKIKWIRCKYNGEITTNKGEPLKTKEVNYLLTSS